MGQHVKVRIDFMNLQFNIFQYNVWVVYLTTFLQTSVQQLAKIPDFRRYGIDEKYFQAPVLFPFYTAFGEVCQ